MDAVDVINVNASNVIHVFRWNDEEVQQMGDIFMSKRDDLEVTIDNNTKQKLWIILSLG